MNFEANKKRPCVITGLPSDAKIQIMDDARNWAKFVPVCAAYADLRQAGKVKKFKHLESLAHKIFYEAEMCQDLGEAWTNHLERLKPIWKEVRPFVEPHAALMQARKQEDQEQVTDKVFGDLLSKFDDLEIE